MNKKHLEKIPYQNSHFFHTTSGREIHYRTWGNRSAKKRYVFIHGFAVHTVIWEDVIEKFLEEDVYILAIDTIGFGYSEKVIDKDLSVKKISTWNIELLQSISYEKWILVSHSLGALFAKEMGILAPSLFSKIIFIAPAITQKLDLWRKIVIFFANIPPFFYLIEKAIAFFFANKYYAEFRWNKSSTRKITEREINEYLSIYKKSMTIKSQLSLIQNIHKCSFENVSRLGHSVKVIWGENDNLTPIKNMKWLKKPLPHAEYVIIKKGNHLFEDTIADYIRE